MNDRQPVAFAKQPGNVPDVISIQNATRQLQCFDIDKPVVLTDNGFYSQANMAEFAWNSMKFLTLASPSSLWIREIVDELRDRLDSVSSVCSFDTSVHCASKMVMKELSVVRQRPAGSSAGRCKEAGKSAASLSRSGRTRELFLKPGLEHLDVVFLLARREQKDDVLGFKLFPAPGGEL